MTLAYHNLLQDKARSLLSIIGVGLAIMLILILNGFLNGVYQSAATYLANEPGSVVVARQDVKNFIVAGSLLAPGTADAVGKTKGVGRVIPLLTQAVYVEQRGQKRFIELVGYDSRLGGGPWNLVVGREPRTDKEVVIDRVLAGQQNIALGDSLPILNRSFTVVGLSAGTNTWMMSFAFVRTSAAESLLLAPGATNYLLVIPARGVRAETVRDRLDILAETEVVLKSQMMTNDVSLLTRVYSLPMQSMTTIAFFVGVLVVGLIISTATTERQREYGVLKAIGARNRMLYRVVVTQAGLVATMGGLLGLGLALSLSQLIMMVRPQFIIALEPLTIVQALVAALLMALFAALFPARLIAVLAPADVFRR